MKTESTSTRSYQLIKDTHGIIHQEIIREAHIDILEAKKGEAFAFSLNEGEKMLALIDAGNFHTITPEAPTNK